MKKAFFILLLIFLFFTNYLKAQEQYLNKSSNEIRESMKNLNYELIGTGRTNDKGSKYFTYESSPQTLSFFFDMNDDICTSVIEFEPQTLVSTILYNLNKSYIKMDNSFWETFDNKIKIKVVYDKPLKTVILTYSPKL